ncbi:MAG: hypothetical protein ACFFD3_01270 [Candidatus Thorarchaeota archaeon]
MAIDFDEDSGQKGQSLADYTVSASGLVSRTLSLWFRKLPHYILIAGGIITILTLLEVVTSFYILGELYTAGLPSDITSFIVQALYTLLYPSSVSETYSTLMIISSIFLVISLIVNGVVVGAVVKLALDDYTSRSGNAGKSLSFAVSRFVPMVVAIVIINLIVGLFMAPGNVLLLYSLENVDLINMIIPEEMLTGLMLFVVLGIPVLYIIIRLSPIYAVVIAEDVTGTGAFNRAFQMTRGHFMHVFTGLFVIFIVNFVLDLFINILVGGLELILGPPLTLLIYNLIGLLLFTPLTYIFFAVLYMDLESRARVAPQEYW